ncbi:MAG: apolipoprotein N-acyltransferase [Phycisphaerales bacterium]|nr:apolipoprotein N-acyltransferase [Phycisphaerales bacterium]
MLKDWFDVERRPFAAALLWGLLHAALFGCAFPPVGLGPLMIPAMVPPIVVAWKTRRAWRSALGFGLASAPMWGGHHWFISDISAAGFPVLVAYLSLWPGLFVLIASKIRRAVPTLPALLIVPAVWGGLEVLRGDVVWNGYPWYLAGHPLIWSDSARFIGTVAGVYGVGAWLALSAGLALDVVRWFKGRGKATGDGPPEGVVKGVGVAWALFLVMGAVVSTPPPTRGPGTFRAAVVQTNLPQSNKMAWPIGERLKALDSWLALTGKAAEGEKRPDVIVWPETMYPGLFGLNRESLEEERRAGLSAPASPSGTGERIPSTLFAQRLLEKQANLGIPMLVGAIAAEGLRIRLDDTGRVSVTRDREFNSAVVIEDGRPRVERYDKLFLTPFGETMPYISNWKWLEQRLLALGATGMEFNLSPGDRPVRPEIPLLRPAPERKDGKPEPPKGPAAARLATPICFEVTIPWLNRRLVFEDGQRKADVLLNLTNDGWFGASDGARANHLLISRWRCIELGTPMIRAANTGISAAIDARGRVLVQGVEGSSRGGSREEGILRAEVSLPPDGETTIYARNGDVVAYFALATMLVMLVVSLIPSRTPGGRTGGGERQKDIVARIGPGPSPASPARAPQPPNR